MSDVPSPKASRQSRPKWLDPKLFLGILLVLGSMAAGARIIGQADKTTSVWIAAEDIQKGAPISPDSFETADIRFTSDAERSKYIAPGADVPEGARATRKISQGELVARTAITNEQAPNLKDIPLPVSNTTVAGTLAQGDHVDVWLQPKESSTDEAEPMGIRALQDVLVIDAPEEGSLGSGSAVTVRVNMNKAAGFDPATFLGQMSEMRVVLFKVPSPDEGKGEG